tara:strand:+ start:237 stop:539 length:303 start_codon:yes stop_codon:yes gene_type:complete
MSFYLTTTILGFLYGNYQILFLGYGYYNNYNKTKYIYNTTKNIIDFINPKSNSWEIVDNITIVDPVQTNIILSNEITFEDFENSYIHLDIIRPINRVFEF